MNLPNEAVLNELNLTLDLNKGVVIANKPSGINTHASDQNKNGFVEWLNEKLNLKLLTVQRLDKGTSGVIVFALNSDTANKLTEALKTKRVLKKYLFLTDKNHKQNEFTVSGDIVRKGNSYSIVIESEGKSFCKTHFKKINQFKEYSLWEAQPETGKPHQIRVHAQHAGLSILGDEEHGGTSFIRLCLHCSYSYFHDLEIESQSQAPLFFTELHLLENKLRCLLESAWHRRLMAYNLNKISKLENPHQNCFRWVHNEAGSFKIDVFNDTAWVYDYSQKIQTIQTHQTFQSHSPALDCQWNEIDVHQTLIPCLESKNIKNYYIREMKNRGQAPLSSNLNQNTGAPSDWIIVENGIKLQLRSQQGLSPGLFLDQRENRKFILNHSNQRNVLNLFSYTGGFSVVAAKGGAASVTTVDLSSTFIEWAKTNFLINGLQNDNYKFWSADARIFIEGSKKRNQNFDLIICDPPSFARGKNNIFKLETDIGKLVYSLFEILSPNGMLLFSCNFEKWSKQFFIKKCLDHVDKNKKFKYNLITPPMLSLDYEFPDEDPLLKTLILTRIN